MEACECHYQIGNLLGQGVFGEVFEAEEANESLNDTTAASKPLLAIKVRIAHVARNY